MRVMVIFALEFHRNFGYRDLFYYFVRFLSKKIAGAEEEKTGAGFARFARFARKDKRGAGFARLTGLTGFCRIRSPMHQRRYPGFPTVLVSRTSQGQAGLGILRLGGGKYLKLAKHPLCPYLANLANLEDSGNPAPVFSC